jgi:NADPH2:quinone reductase
VGQGQLNTELGAGGGTLAVSRNGAAVEFNDGAYDAEAQAGFTDSLRSLVPEGRMLVVGFTGGEIPTVSAALRELDERRATEKILLQVR